ncbi:MAG: FkbM family methyltransferase [Coriobacteriia bacterium]|nr:FkbM family methyltransferase [Coriobacteriia bacterium]
MSLAQRLKDSLPDDVKRRVRESRHGGSNDLGGALLSLDRDIRVIFDVGANVGNVSLHFLRWFPAAIVHGFEPATQMYAEMNQRISEAGFSDRFRPHQIGFFDQETDAELNLASHHGANSLIGISDAYHTANPHISLGATESVSLVRMDDFVRSEGIDHIDLVKIDVEGVEDQVLAGGADTLSTIVDAVIMEMSFVRHDRNEGSYLNLFTQMHELGFAPAYIFEVEQSDPDVRWRLNQLDCLFRKY